MSSSEHDDIDELLQLIDIVGPVPAEFEQRLYNDLRRSLAAGPIDGPSNLPDRSDLVRLEPEQRQRHRVGRLRTAWLVSAAAIVLLLAGLVVIGPRGSGQRDVADQPDETVPRSTQPVPVLADLAEACERFGSLAPDRTTLVELVGSGTPEGNDALPDLLNALELLRIDVETHGLLDFEALRRFTLAQGYFGEAEALRQQDRDASDAIRRGDDQLGNLAAEVPEFVACRN